MGKKRKLTPREKAEKKRRQREFMTIFINGKQKRVRRPPTIDGIPVDEFIRQNADPIWLLQNEEWELREEYNNRQSLIQGKPQNNRYSLFRRSLILNSRAFALIRGSMILICVYLRKSVADFRFAFPPCSFVSSVVQGFWLWLRYYLSSAV